MPFRLQNQTLSDQRIVVDDDHWNVLGPGLTLRNCEIEIHVPAEGLSVQGIDLDGCVVRTRRPLVNFPDWLSSNIRRTRFLGTFKGNDFGTAPWKEVRGIAEALDFSGAVLDGCRVFGSDLESFVWPSWPNFTILDPLAHAEQLTPPLASWFPEIVQQPALSAIAFYAPKQLKYLADKSMTVEQLRDALPNAPWLKR
jgi:hypothetical protein